METSHPTPAPETPADFPRDQPIGAVPGAQPKSLARKIDGKYVVGLTAEELYARYDMCFDLVNQLVDYGARKRREHPEWTLEVLLDKLQKGVAARRDFGLSADEQAWVLSKLGERIERSWNERR